MVNDMDALIAAADALADRAKAVFDSEYHNTRHLEGALPYYEANREALTAYSAAREARLATAEMDSRSYQAMAADAIHRMDSAKAEVASLTAQLATARRDARDDVLQSVGELLAGTPEKDVSPAARGKIRVAIIRAFDKDATP